MSPDTARAGDERIWGWLAEVPDPEIPIVSVVDLGIVRDVRWEEGTLVVSVTPTYSGCPATRVIEEDIVAHLRARGVEEVRIERRLSPAWTSAWLSESGREKLRAYGIAPPVEDGAGCAAGRAAPSGAAVVRVRRPGERDAPAAGAPLSGALAGPPGAPNVACPRCGAEGAERISQFGSTPCKASYRCRECLEPFDYFKCH